MKVENKFQKLMLQEDLNFLLTNRIPRIALTRLMGWWSRLRHPWIVKGSIAVWRWFTELDLSEAKEKSFDSLHACFTRELKPGLRPVDPRQDVMTSPCDCIIGACGEIRDGIVYQAKGFPYTLKTLLSAPELMKHWPPLLEGGTFVTMRLTSSMYHRFHAPTDAHLSHVTYISGDTWNVNPIALTRIEELFCKNERAVLQMQSTMDVPFLLVPVAAVLVASMRFHAVDVLLNLRYRGANEIPCDATYAKGQEMGWFEHGSTILMFVPPGFVLAEGVGNGQHLRMGEALLVRAK
ncbi:MAG: Phosphatidylserine decarboxylase proenzyme [Pseudomonadota bacterium]|jgi:phosphatidylserine decarboxylase